MERLTMRAPKRLLDEIDTLVENGYYPNRSEAIRTAIRDMLNEQRRIDERRLLPEERRMEVQTDAD